MKVAVIIVRIVMGLLFLVSAIGFFFNLMPQPELSGNAQLFIGGMAASVYLFPLLKVIETLCAIAFLSGRFVPLATVVIFPVTVNILLYHSFLAPQDMIIPVLLFLANVFLAYHYRRNYEMVLAAR
jgi:uncharacterized membrane protein YphA (DoxX/SURF4 family)